jgi:hypothetical protein
MSDLLEEKVEEAEQYSKRPSLHIANMGPFRPEDDFPGLVIGLAADIGVNLARRTLIVHIRVIKTRRD